MNKRQKIKKLKTENEFLRNIIHNSPDMEDLLRRWTQPMNVIKTTKEVKLYKSARYLPPDSDVGLIAFYKKELANDIFEGVKEKINYNISTGDAFPKIEASIYIG